jgi:hypothetical protein
MGVSAEIRPKKGKSLGNAADVRAALERHFPGVKIVRYENNFDKAALKSFAKTLLQSWMPVKLIGPSSPFAFNGDFEGSGWSMQVEFDDADSIPIAYVSFYGNFDAAQPNFDALFATVPWKLKVY